MSCNVRSLNYVEPNATRTACQSQQARSEENPEVSKDDKLVKHEHHPNSAEEGDTANIKQNTTNEGYFRGRRQS